ncbi:ATP-binding protein [Leptodesmis sp.]|uniref:ATP-binding protein n=1 Tax=Leptodesmis sp. TaxID=3100501 RepID=UPI00405358FD
MSWPLTILYGESGVGKSSVLRAGVIHALRQEAQQNIEDYGCPKLAVVIFPSLEGERFWQQDPLQSLIQQIAADMGQSGFPMQPPDPGLSFVETLQAWIEQLGEDSLDGRLFIILDQFEEYFQYHPQEEQEGGLIAEISKAIAYPDLHVNFLISLREDSYAKLNRLREYIPGILDICLPLEYLDKPSAQEAIVQPIEHYNQKVAPEQAVEITPDLVDALLQRIPRVKQGGDGRAGLDKLEPIRENQLLTPYLQLVMIRLWDEMVKANSRYLNLQMLTRLADRNAKDDTEKITSAIQKIVQDHVVEIMHGLSANEQDIAARSFQYLVTPSGTKYAYSVADLANLVGCKSTELDDLLQKLAKDQRIIRSVGTDQSDIPRYEIFHDFLATAILEWRKRYLEEKQRSSVGEKGYGL